MSSGAEVIESSGTADTSDPETVHSEYKGGTYEWRSDDGLETRTLSVYVADNGAVEIYFDGKERCVSYNSLSETETFSAIFNPSNGESYGAAKFNITVNTVTLTYEKTPDEHFVYKKV